MNLLHRSNARDASRRSATSKLYLRVALIGAAIGGLCGFATGCSDAQVAGVQKAETAVVQDATSPAGQKLLQDVTVAALNIGLDYATGNESGIAVAGIQGVASAVRDYEGMPTAPSAATIGKVAAAGAGVTTIAGTIAPTIEAIVANAQGTAKTKGIAVKTDDIIEALAKGFDAVAPAKGV